MYNLNNYLMKTKLLGLFVILISLLACQEGEISTLDEGLTGAEMSLIKNPEKFLVDNFKVLGASVASLANETEFRELLYWEVEKQFDGDYNVLFETLLSQELPEGRVSSTLSHSSLSDVLETFKVAVEGEELYPQIYIPYFEEMNARKSASRQEGETPLLVLYDGDESTDVFPSYSLNDAGELEETGIMIDEEYGLILFLRC